MAYAQPAHAVDSGTATTPVRSKPYSLTDHLAWLFKPGRFLFGKDARSILNVPGWASVHFVDTQDEVHAVNKATGDVFLGGAGNAFLEALLGPQSVFLLDHKRHRLARKIMSPMLTRKVARDWQPQIDRIIDDALDEAQLKGRINVGHWSRNVAMRVVCQVALGLSDARTVEQLFKRMETTTGYLANFVSYAKRWWRPHGPVSVGAIVALLVRRVDTVLYEVIEARRKQRPQNAENALDALLAAQEKHGYDDAFIRDNITALLAAGYDTTGSALTWMTFWMSREPEKVVGLARAQTAGHHKCLEGFRNEVLRYCPPVEILPRRVDPAKVAHAKRAVPGLQGDGPSDAPMVCPFVHRIHHDPSVYDKPATFEPERFAGHKYSPDEFLPFGAGQRMCLGINLGRFVLDRVLARALERGVTFDMSKRFDPVRRNVSIWPAFFPHARVVELQRS